MESIDVFAPLASLQWVDRNTIHANDYNPNKVSEENLKLLVQSILTNGWTLPIVVRPDGTIIDGFHRWTVSGREPLLSLLGGKVPVVVVDHHGDESADVYGTITHNRARGTHLLDPMKAIVKKLMDEGKTVDTHVDMAIQVNGKLKGAVTVPAGSGQETVMAAAMELDKVRKATEGMTVVKTILVKDKLMNLIVKPAK